VLSIDYKVYQDDQAQFSDSVVKAETARFETNSGRTPGELSGAPRALLTSEKWRSSFLDVSQVLFDDPRSDRPRSNEDG
jgi:hypothetical protein